MRAPSISIGLPVYNGAGFLEAAVESLLGQDERDVELIISDNASEDATRDICAQLAERDPRVRYVRNATNLGANRNFMRVLELARGELFMWASHDDLWSSDYVGRLAARFTGDDVVLSAGRTIYMTEDGAPAAIPPAAAPPAEAVRPSVLVGQLLRERATSWFYGLYRRAFVSELLGLLRDVPVWGGDLIFLMRCCLRDGVRGDDRAVIRKRLRTHASHQPATPRAWVRWQRLFAASMVREVFAARLPLAETWSVLGHLRPFLQEQLFRKGPRGTALLWLRAAYQLSQGRDHA